ncbi:MAG: agmatine deiminase family protein [Gammaproteobacteria bacterium]|nr:agmatine deiminase family protein [Gammaproteobacteria bacterium]
MYYIKSTIPGISKAIILYQLHAIITLLLLSFVASTVGADQHMNKRVPAEWEAQEAIWLQWPGRWEKIYEPAFARMASIIPRYEKLHILCNSKTVCNQARQTIEAVGGKPEHSNIIWHQVPVDNAWMRDNGPVFIVEDGRMRIQNWQFDAWGGAFGNDVSYRNDNRIPSWVGEYLKLPVDRVDIVHERGNLEFNGVDTVLLNWSTIGDPQRNSGYTREQAVQDLKHHFGVEKVIMVEGIPSGDLTRGHIDGFARFINTTTIVVSQCTEHSSCKPGDSADGAIYDEAAKTIESAGFRVIRDPILGTTSFKGQSFDTNYLNWLVGNGFVIAVGFDNPETDAAAKKRIESYFPGRDVFLVEMLESWNEGGGVHCHTNDQPAL